MYISSCYGGGLLEENAKHTDLEALEDYQFTAVNVSSELGGNAVVWYPDCANSPAWTKNNLLYNLRGTLSGETYVKNTYQEEVDCINEMVTSIRTANINVFINLLKENYQFMTEHLLDMSKLRWTQQTYNDSVGGFIKANNLIILLSRQTNEVGEKNARERYPILFLFWMLSEFMKDPQTGNNSNSFWVHDPVKPLSDFVKIKKLYLEYNKMFRRILKDYLKPQSTRFFHPNLYNSYIKST